MIVWTDVETTSFDERHHLLLEVALVITDDDLVERGSVSVVIRPPFGADQARKMMDEYVLKMHTENGLLAELDGGVSLDTAGDMLVDFVTRSFLAKECPVDEGKVFLSKIPFAGSTVGFDRRWLRHHVPRLESMLRSIDVSSFTEVAKRWAPLVYEARPKAGAAHRALADARESIEYLRFYRRVGFVNGNAWKNLCVGYPQCDGDLEGMEHDEKCPLWKKNEVPNG